MKASRLIGKLQELIKIAGNAEIKMDDHIVDFDVIYKMADGCIHLEKVVRDPNN